MCVCVCVLYVCILGLGGMMMHHDVLSGERLKGGRQCGGNGKGKKKKKKEKEKKRKKKKKSPSCLLSPEADDNEPAQPKAQGNA